MDHVATEYFASYKVIELGEVQSKQTPLAEVERNHIARLLKLHDGHRERTARALVIGQRTLYRKLKEYGLD